MGSRHWTSFPWIWLLFVALSSGPGRAAPQPVGPPGETASWREALADRAGSETIYKENLHLFEYDRGLPLGTREVRRWEEDGLTFVDLLYESPKEGQVPATLIEPPGAGPFAGVIIQHGLPSRRQAQYELGKLHANLGAVVVLIDAPFARPENRNRRPVTLTEQDRRDQIQLIVDLRRAVDLLAARDDVDPDRLAYVGVSYGGAVGGLLAGVEDRLRAYVLVKGDCGLVDHLMFQGGGRRSALQAMPENARTEWIDAMWPIESIHYLGHAHPAALLFQNGTLDRSVPPDMARICQAAGSEPKTIEWYESGHTLPFQHVVDQLEWLSPLIGTTDVGDLPRVDLALMGPAEDFVTLSPGLQKTAVLVDRLMVVWFAMVAGALLYVARELLGGSASSRGEALGWLPAALFFGPLALLARSISRRGARTPDSDPPPAGARAVGATIRSAAGHLIGLVWAIAVLDRHRQLYGSPLLVLVLVAGLPLATGWAMNRLSRPRRSWSAELLSTNLVVAVVLPVAALIVRRWLYTWYPSPGWHAENPPFWAIVTIAACAAAVVAYPAHVWMIRRGLEERAATPPAKQPQTTKPVELAAWGAVLASYLVLLVCFHLTFGMIL